MTAARAFGIGQSEALDRFSQMFSGCVHRQAEPVVLSTGETVACVCVECLAALSAGYVDRQLEHALLEAFCRHESLIEITDMCSAEPTFLCQRCGVSRP